MAVTVPGVQSRYTFFCEESKNLFIKQEKQKLKLNFRIFLEHWMKNNRIFLCLFHYLEPGVTWS